MDLVSLVLYASLFIGLIWSLQCCMHQSLRDRCNLLSAICINLQGTDVIILPNTNNKMM